MYKRLLVPTDGSELSLDAVRETSTETLFASLSLRLGGLQKRRRGFVRAAGIMDRGLRKAVSSARFPCARPFQEPSYA